MIRFLALAIATLFAAPALAQQVLLQRAPTYQNGEHAPMPGVLINQYGQTFEMSQFAEVEAGSTYINMVIRNEIGDVVMRGKIDAKTFTGEEKYGDVVVKTVNNTCPAPALYPLMAGKQYECTAEHEPDGEERYTSKRIYVFRAVTDRAGRPAGYCGRVEHDDPGLYMVFESCYSADGKWITQLHILKFEEKRKA